MGSQRVIHDWVPFTFRSKNGQWIRERTLGQDFGSHQASLVAQMVKCLPAMQETQVQSLGQKDPLEKEMATHSSTLAYKIPWTEESGGLQSMGLQRVGHHWATSLSFTYGSHLEMRVGLATCMGQIWLCDCASVCVCLHVYVSVYTCTPLGLGRNSFKISGDIIPIPCQRKR